jgi:diaminohydroxyphosphoribosylaminopyrimidine deaminase/5-amino-6-(5-phosphoribosylamino)uracil reductase
MPDEKMHGDRLTKRDALAAAERDAAFMGEALELAETGRGRTHPNPRVGALLVRDGVVVGRGAHMGPGTAHAEAAALAEAGGTARGATLYCTLEPCNHFGMTPPCADAIVAAGVARAVVAMRDPNPLVDGRGFEKLRRGGVSVTLLEGEPARRAARQNEPFVKYIETGLPLVTYKAAVSLDGKVAAAGGDARWISGAASRAAVHRLRAGSDAVMVGAGTVRRDDPELTVRDAAGRDPVRVVVSRGGELPPRAKVLAAAATPTIVLCDRPPAAAARVAQVDYVSTGGDLVAGLRELARRGLLDILCEGGPSLAAGLLGAGLLDRLLVFVAPLVIGRGAPDLLASAAVHSVAAAHRLTEVEWRTIGDDLVVEGRLANDEAGRQRDDTGRANDMPASAATGGEV